jgi:integrase/recombinase XerC/integrase/recombinase XerD
VSTYSKKYPDQETAHRERVMRPWDKVPTQREVEDLLAAARARGSRRDFMVLYLMANLGLRPGEIARLARPNFKDLAQGVVWWNRLKVKKDPAAYKFVPAPVAGEIHAFLASMPADQVYLFPGRKRGSLSVRSIQNIFWRYAEISGIRKKLTPRCLRHYYASILRTVTQDLGVIQEQVGHKSVRTTETYLHVFDATRKRVVDGVPSTGGWNAD